MAPSKERAQALNEAATKLAEAYPENERSAFVKGFVDVWGALEEQMEDRLGRLDIDATPLVTDMLPYQPTTAAYVVNAHVGRIRTLSAVSVNSLLAVHPPTLRVEMLDTLIDVLTMAREPLFRMDREVVDRLTPPS